MISFRQQILYHLTDYSGEILTKNYVRKKVEHRINIGTYDSVVRIGFIVNIKHLATNLQCLDYIYSLVSQPTKL